MTQALTDHGDINSTKQAFAHSLHKDAATENFAALSGKHVAQRLVWVDTPAVEHRGEPWI